MATVAGLGGPGRLLLTESGDRSASFELAQAAASNAFDDRALVLKGLGHYALLENPELCYTTLKREGDL